MTNDDLMSLKENIDNLTNVNLFKRPMSIWTVFLYIILILLIIGIIAWKLKGKLNFRKATAQLDISGEEESKRQQSWIP